MIIKLVDKMLEKLSGQFDKFTTANANNSGEDLTTQKSLTADLLTSPEAILSNTWPDVNDLKKSFKKTINKKITKNNNKMVTKLQAKLDDRVQKLLEDADGKLVEAVEVA